MMTVRPSGAVDAPPTDLALGAEEKNTPTRKRKPPGDVALATPGAWNAEVSSGGGRRSLTSPALKPREHTLPK